MSNNLESLKFEFLNKSDFSANAQQIFDILADNMSVIAPTGNSRKEDFILWSDAVGDGLQKPERKIILIKEKENLIGYFQYYTNTDTFMMEEIQLRSEYHGKGVFRELYGFILNSIKADLEFVEAYANMNNKKSIAILKKLGLINSGLNKNGHSYYFKGNFLDLIKWYENK